MDIIEAIKLAKDNPGVDILYNGIDALKGYNDDTFSIHVDGQTIFLPYVGYEKKKQYLYNYLAMSSWANEDIVCCEFNGRTYTYDCLVTKADGFVCLEDGSNMTQEQWLLGKWYVKSRR